MKSNIGMWVHDQGGGDFIHNDTIPTLLFNDYKNQSYAKAQLQHPDILMSSVDELQRRLTRLEVESAEKDAIVQNLQSELIEIKKAKSDIQNQINSREIEIQMQKEQLTRPAASTYDDDWDWSRIEEHFLRGTMLGKGDRCDTNVVKNWTSEKVKCAENEVEKLKFKNEALNLRSDLLEKNLLIYHTHQLLRRLEDNCLPGVEQSDGNLYSDQIENNEVEVTSPEISVGLTVDVQNSTSTYNALVDSKEAESNNNLSELGVSSVISQVRDKIDSSNSSSTLQLGRRVGIVGLCSLYADTAMENSELEIRLNESRHEARQLRIIIENEKFGAQPKEDKIEHKNSTGCFSTKSGEYQLNHSSHQGKQSPKSLTNYTSTTFERVRQKGWDDPKKKLAVDEIIRLQGEQINRYETYVKRLHEEIRVWASPGKVPFPSGKFMDSSACDSVIGVLRKKIERDIELFESNEKASIELSSKLKNLQCELEQLRKSESALALENRMLHDIIADLNKYFATKN